MPTTTTLLLSLFSATIALAAPTQPSGFAIPIQKRITTRDNSSALNIDALKSQLNGITHKYALTSAAYEQNTGNALPFDKPSSWAKRAGSGGVPLTDSSNELWFGTIKVGTPPAEFTIDFDTGSSDLFVPAKSCKNCGQHQTYNPSSSSTSKDLGQTFSLQYGDGSTTNGEIFSDTVTMAGLTATKQAVGAATDYSQSFTNGPSDGLMGMAFPSLSSYKQQPFFNSLMDQKKVAAGEFGFYLADSGSELFLGGANSARYKGSFTWAPVTDAGYWQIAVSGVSVGGKKAVSAISGIVDSGTTLIAGDFQNVAALYKQIPGSQDLSSTVGSGFYGFPCNSPPKNLSFQIAGKSFTVSSQALNLGPVQQGSSTCVGGVVGMDLPFWILGDVFMRNFYTVFSFDKNSVGFADLK